MFWCCFCSCYSRVLTSTAEPPRYFGRGVRDSSKGNSLAAPKLVLRSWPAAAYEAEYRLPYLYLLLSLATVEDDQWAINLLPLLPRVINRLSSTNGISARRGWGCIEAESIQRDCCDTVHDLLPFVAHEQIRWWVRQPGYRNRWDWITYQQAGANSRMDGQRHHVKIR